MNPAPITQNPTSSTQNPTPSTSPSRPNGEFRPTGEVPNGEFRPVGETPVYCDCCPHRPKKMAVIQPDAIQIISRRSGRKHIARIPLSPVLHPSNGTKWHTPAK